MNKTLLAALMPFIVAFFWMLSVFLFLRGHNEPGGGFIAALCFVLGLLALSFSFEDPRKLFSKLTGVAYTAIVIGLGCFVVSFSVSYFLSGIPLKAMWTKILIPVAGKFSSVLIFDLGVYLVVAASATLIFQHVFSEALDD